MAKKIHDDVYKEKFRPDDSALDKQLDAELAGVSMEALYSFDKPQAESQSVAAGAKGSKRGRIVSIGKDDVFVDFGGKSQGVCSVLQFEEEPQVGQELEFDVDRYDTREGLLVLTRRGAKATNVSWENLQVGQIIEGTVTGVNKGGLELEIKSMRAFMPAGQCDLYHVPDLEQFMGQRMTVEVTQCERESRNLIVSRRNILEREKEVAKKKLMEELAEGQIRRGTVRNVMDFGAFVDLGGADGLLHVSEMSFRRGRSASEFVKIGDVIDVKIIKFDKESGKMSLSLKQARGTDPWGDAGSKYAVGSSLTGRVVKLETFGAFIEVEEGVEGLLPISEMSWKRIKHPSDIVKENDTVKLIVLSVDPTQRRISFSLKQAGPDPWTTVSDRYATDMVVTGTITRTTDFGAFVELESGIEGLVHISELSNQRVRTTTDVVKPGQEVRVRVLEIDKEQRRIALSIRTAADVAPAETPATGTATGTPAQPKKKRPQLRGGLDF